MIIKLPFFKFVCHFDSPTSAHERTLRQDKIQSSDVKLSSFLYLSFPSFTTMSSAPTRVRRVMTQAINLIFELLKNVSSSALFYFNILLFWAVGIFSRPALQLSYLTFSLPTPLISHFFFYRKNARVSGCMKIPV